MEVAYQNLRVDVILKIIYYVMQHILEMAHWNSKSWSHLNWQQ